MFSSVPKMLEYIENLKRGERKTNLSFMEGLCAIFDNPQQSLRFIHIGGTNGKGSTVAFVQSILRKAKFRVGTFISPYVVCFNERITYDGAYISDADILHYGNLIIDHFPQIEKQLKRFPSFFEFLTILAFLYFADIPNLDFVVLEVGIGGTLDCTNVVMPLVSAVTNVSYDHMNILGDTLDEIWDNKLGIAKQNVPFITHENEVFFDKITQTCASVGAPLLWVYKKDIKNVIITPYSTTFDYQQYHNLTLQLLGEHQTENAAIAIKIIHTLRKHYSISDDAIIAGLEDAHWPGRLELVSKTPLMFIDGAHNVGGITRLKEFIIATKTNVPIRLVFAVSANKEKDKMIALLDPVVDEIIFTHFAYKRSDEAIHLFELSHHPNKKIIDDLDTIINLCYQDNYTVTFFCGSLYFISEIRNRFKR